MLTRHPSRQSAMSNGHPSVSDNAADEVILVDADDRPVGTVAKLDAHRRGLRHRAMSVIVRDRRDRLLLQQRAAGKYHSGGLWTNTCCGHPRTREQQRRVPQCADEKHRDGCNENRDGIDVQSHGVCDGYNKRVCRSPSTSPRPDGSTPKPDDAAPSQPG